MSETLPEIFHGGSWGARPPTSVWPPCPPPGPWPAGLYRLNECWDDVAKTKAFLAKIMKEIIAEDPSIIAVGTPVVGVTDGSDAVAGMVGQFIQTATTVGYTANTNQTSFLNAASLPAGDWDCWWYTNYDTGILGAQNFLSPIPPGFSGDMNMNFSQVGAATVDDFNLASPAVRGLISVATPMVFNITILPSTSNGTLTFVFNARRRR